MRCPACGFENSLGLRFCGQCGTRLTPTASSIEERKLVTILFVDVVGSTRMLGTLDAEQVRGQMAHFFSIAQEEIHRFGGTIDKFIGDAVMAVFGLPATHEDDPERAARAALRIKTLIGSYAEVGALPEIHIGINTGEVVANAQATGTGDFLVTGSAVNLAARLQQNAAPGQILVGERTMQSLRHVARLRPIPALKVKDMPSTLPAWELIEVFPPRERQLAPTAFVDREEDVDLLRGLARRMRRDGRGHVVTILGVAGVGKTRLVQEFHQYAADAHILRGRALPYGGGVPYWALAEVIRDECGILFGDSSELARDKLRYTGLRLNIGDSIPALGTILGLTEEHHELPREMLFTGMRALFESLAERAPLFITLEDIHCAEDVTLDFVEQAADWVRDVPVLFIVLSRPDLLERRPNWMGGKRNAITLFLDPLAREHSRELASAALGGKTAPDPLFDLILTRAEGNPLFMEEMVRALRERNVIREEQDRWTLRIPLAQLTVPDTVHAVIAARIDALPASEKQALQNAAIVGKDFWLGALNFIAGENHVDETVRGLLAKDLLVHKHRSTFLGEEEFAFRHILIRDVVYSMLPKSQRWQKHVRCAEWLQQFGGDRAAELADFIAHHWLQVVMLRQELGQPPDPKAREEAIAHLILAGDRAASLYSNTTALDHYTRALEMDPSLQMRRKALLGRGQVSMLLGKQDKARADFESVRALARETGEPRWEAVALDHLGQSFRRQDQIDEALGHLKPALALSRRVGDPALTGRILNHIGSAYYSVASTEEAIRSHEEARQLLEDCGDLAGLAESLHGLGENAIMQGRFADCIKWSLESVRLSEQIANRSLTGENRYMIAVSRLIQGEYSEAGFEVQRSMEELAAIGDVWNSSFALGAAARVATAVGEFGKALDYATQGLRLARQIEAGRQEVFNMLLVGAVNREMENLGDAWRIDQEAAELAKAKGMAAYVMPLVLCCLALDMVGIGRQDEAQALTDEARRVLGDRPSRADYPQQMAYVQSRVLLALGRADDARRRARALVDEATATGTLHWRIPAMLLLAESTAFLGEHREAASLYDTAAKEAELHGCSPLHWRALAGLAETQLAVHQPDAAVATALQAQTITNRLAASVPDESLRAAFLASAKVQRIVTILENADKS
jgi:class 3 adenylate cyclase/tetratricopeptide (TPR) repeat protein